VIVMKKKKREISYSAMIKSKQLDTFFEE